MAKNQDRQAQAMQYMQLLQSGVPAADAFKQAYPNGIPTQAQELAQQSKDKQNSALMGTGGTIAGLLGVKYGTDYLSSLGGDAAAKEAAKLAAEEAAKNTAANTGSTVAGGGGGGYGGGEVATEAAPGLLSQAPGTTLMGSETAGSFLPGAGIVAGAYTGYQQAKGLQSAYKGDDLSFQQQAALALPTFGGSFLYNPIKNKFFNHKSTREVASDHTNSLMKDAGSDAVAQNYVQGMREQYNTAPVGPAFNGGQFKTFDEYRKAGLDPKDLSGVYGNMKTFGPAAWANLSQDQRESVTQGLIGADLYKSKKGEVEITDTDKAKQIYATILAQSQPKQTVRNAPAVVNPELASKQIAQTGAFGNQLLQALSNSKKK